VKAIVFIGCALLLNCILKNSTVLTLLVALCGFYFYYSWRFSAVVASFVARTKLLNVEPG